MSTIKANYILDAAGGNTATINGAIPAPATSPTLTTPIISGNLGAGGANYGTSGQVLTSGGAGASTSWSTIVTGGMTLLGTLTTTSGTTQTLSGLTLTSYKLLYVFFNGPAPTASATLWLSGGYVLSPSTGSLIYGNAFFDLASGRYISTTYGGGAGTGTATSFYGNPAITTASTSITFTWSIATTFYSGSILIYGVK